MPGPDQSYVLQFEDQLEDEFQQMQAYLEKYVRVKSNVTGDKTAFSPLGQTELREITGDRHGVSQWHDSPSYRRWAVKRDFIDQQIIDEEDDLAVLVDLEMGYARNAMYAVERKVDELIIDAVTATAVSGRNGTDTTSAVFDTSAPSATGGGGNQIADGALSLKQKLIDARGIYLARNVGKEEIRAGVTDAFVALVDGYSMKQFLTETEMTSRDYVQFINDKGAVQTGFVYYFAGFRIEVTDQLNTDATTGFPIICTWHRRAMGAAFWKRRSVRVSNLPEHNDSRGVTTKVNLGAVRIHDRGVITILHDNT